MLGAVTSEMSGLRVSQDLAGSLLDLLDARCHARWQVATAGAATAYLFSPLVASSVAITTVDTRAGKNEAHPNPASRKNRQRHSLVAQPILLKWAELFCHWNRSMLRCLALLITPSSMCTLHRRKSDGGERGMGCGRNTIGTAFHLLQRPTANGERRANAEAECRTPSPVPASLYRGMR